MVGKFESFSPEPSALTAQPAALHDAFFSAMKPGAFQTADLAAASPASGALDTKQAPAADPTELKFTNLHEIAANGAAGIQTSTADSATAAAKPSDTVSTAPPEGGAGPMEASDAPAPAAGPISEIPAPIQQAIESNAPITFSSSGENQAAGTQPDYFMTPSGEIVHNENAPPPSPDGSVNIEIQSAKPEDNKSLRDAIIHQTEMQKEAAKEMIRLFQHNHPGQPVPEWMNNLANAQPNLPDFAPSSPAPTAPPENGFVNRGVRGGSSAGFAGNGGFDGAGNFRGNGSRGDGSLYSGATDNKGRPLGPGETVQAKQIFDYLTKEHGLPEVVASGVLGNMMTESSMKTNAYNKGEGAIGLCQWEGSRRTDLERFAARHDKPVTDWKVQVDFMMSELKGKESGSFDKLMQAKTPAQAAAIFDKYYERSAGTSRGQRMGNAEQVHRQLANS